MIKINITETQDITNLKIQEDYEIVNIKLQENIENVNIKISELGEKGDKGEFPIISQLPELP